MVLLSGKSLRGHPAVMYYSQGRVLGATLSISCEPPLPHEVPHLQLVFVGSNDRYTFHLEDLLRAFAEVLEKGLKGGILFRCNFDPSLQKEERMSLELRERKEWLLMNDIAEEVRVSPFDIDDTLYPFGSGIVASVRKNIEDYMIEKFGIDDNKVPNLCEALYKDYGTTMAGLKAIGYNFDYEEYHSFVHGKLPYESLKPDLVLRNLLLSLPLHKLIFTNVDKKHASEVLKWLGLEDCFEGIVCFEMLNPPSEPSSKPIEIFNILEHFADPEPGWEIPKMPINCKPNLELMRLALKIAGIESPQRTVRSKSFFFFLGLLLQKKMWL